MSGSLVCLGLSPPGTRGGGGGGGRCLVQAPHLLCPWGLQALLCGPVRLRAVKSLAEVTLGVSGPCSVGSRPPALH